MCNSQSQRVISYLGRRSAAWPRTCTARSAVLCFTENDLTAHCSCQALIFTKLSRMMRGERICINEGWCTDVTVCEDQRTKAGAEGLLWLHRGYSCCSGWRVPTNTYHTYNNSKQQALDHSSAEPRTQLTTQWKVLTGPQTRARQPQQLGEFISLLVEQQKGPDFIMSEQPISHDAHADLHPAESLG